MLDLNRIFGTGRPNDAIRLLGPAPRTVSTYTGGEIHQVAIVTTSLGTFERVVAHSEPGCCHAHDRLRREKRERIS